MFSNLIKADSMFLSVVRQCVLLLYILPGEASACGRGSASLQRGGEAKHFIWAPLLYSIRFKGHAEYTILFSGCVHALFPSGPVWVGGRLAGGVGVFPSAIPSGHSSFFTSVLLASWPDSGATSSLYGL